MTSTAQILLSLGGVFLLGMATDMLGKRSFLPRVTLLLLLGILVGDEFLGLIPASITSRFDLIANMALLMVGFLLGNRLTLKTFQHSGKQIIGISLCTVVVTTAFVTLLLTIAGLPLQISLLLGCISSATAPAASIDSVVESGYRSRFAERLLSIVALDDAWAMIIFSIGLAIVSSINGISNQISPITTALWDIFGAIVLGIAVGIPAAYLTGRLKPGQPILSEALGLVFLIGGLALWLEVSFLIASMVMGSMIANLARHHDIPFHAIEDIEWPIMSLFFILAGAMFEFSALQGIGLFGLIYVVARIIGKIVGAYAGARFSSAGLPTQRWMGIAMLPQAGAAMGMALVAVSQFPQYRQTLISLVIGTTVLFEILGPIMTRMALRQTDSAD